MSDKAIVSIYKFDEKYILSPAQHDDDGDFVLGLTFLQESIAISEVELGQLAWQALRESAESPAASGVDPRQREKESDASLAATAGASNYDELRVRAFNVGVYHYEDNTIDVAPTAHDEEEGSFVTKIKEVLQLGQAPTPESLGAAIREAFERSE